MAAGQFRPGARGSGQESAAQREVLRQRAASRAAGRRAAAGARPLTSTTAPSSRQRQQVSRVSGYARNKGEECRGRNACLTASAAVEVAVAVEAVAVEVVVGARPAAWTGDVASEVVERRPRWRRFDASDDSGRRNDAECSNC